MTGNNTDQRVLYVITSATSAARGVGKLVSLAQNRGWAIGTSCRRSTTGRDAVLLAQAAFRGQGRMSPVRGLGSRTRAMVRCRPRLENNLQP